LLPFFDLHGIETHFNTVFPKIWFFLAKPGFIPEVESYLKKINLDFKVLLLLDNAPGHPKNLNHPNVRVIFLPPNTTSLI
jgi:hypothetical protein